MADLIDKTGVPTGDLSIGYKQRLALGCAMIHRPRIIFLDEPTSGVDPISRRNFWKLIYRLCHEEKVTTIVTTHYLDEAEYCHNLLLIYGGRIIAQETPQNLKDKFAGLTLEEIFIKLILDEEKQ
jgi:ABC-2 type transport system ATP-binding protein